eukprot:GHVU01047547.1.p1 GENE.GHVU01047547.1~~GHVU01047547.1.p1  ORF type:complete len:136 (+),score=6.12 GHVU01047547.1:146-553(+)
MLSCRTRQMITGGQLRCTGADGRPSESPATVLPRPVPASSEEGTAPSEEPLLRDDKQGLQVKLSTITGAGYGLFATRSFEKDEILCEYVGVVRSLREMFHLKDKTYVMGGFGINAHIDAGPCEWESGSRCAEAYN